MELSDQLDAPATLSPGKGSPVLVGLEARWVPEPVWTLWSKEKSLVPAENRTPFFQSIACHTDGAIPAPASVMYE
jgi:hypothetical protein